MLWVFLRRFEKNLQTPNGLFFNSFRGFFGFFFCKSLEHFSVILLGIVSKRTLKILLKSSWYFGNFFNYSFENSISSFFGNPFRIFFFRNFIKNSYEQKHFLCEFLWKTLQKIISCYLVFYSAISLIHYVTNLSEVSYVNSSDIFFFEISSAAVSEHVLSISSEIKSVVLFEILIFFSKAPLELFGNLFTIFLGIVGNSILKFLLRIFRKSKFPSTIPIWY